MLAGQTLIVISAINADVPLDVLAEFFTDFGKDLFLAFRAHGLVREVGVHARTVPIQLAKGLRVPIDGVPVFLAGTL